MINCSCLQQKLEQHWQEASQEQGLTFEKLPLEDLEKCWLLDPLAQFSNIGLGESDLNGEV